MSLSKKLEIIRKTIKQLEECRLTGLDQYNICDTAIKELNEIRKMWEKIQLYDD